MKINLEVNNKSQSPVKDSFFASVAEKTLEKINFKKNVSISLALVKPEEMKEINGKYRSHGEVTDVLSFSEYASQEAIEKSAEGEVFLGEIILCYDDIKGYLKKENINLKKELAKVFSHGILHLAGFSHGKAMFKIQEEISNNF